MRTTLVLLVALVLAGCGGGGHAQGTATLWVTRDRGAHVIFAGSVPAGLDGIQAVERNLKVTTRYGGRFLQSINRISGSLTNQRDWFFFINGIEGDRSATEVTLHPGDVTTEELSNGLFQGLRIVAVGLAFAVYALLLDHDRLLAAAGWARRSTLAVALATRLVPLLERDARDLRVALRGRGVELGPVRQLSPLLAGSLERGLNLAEAMEARGYGRAGRTRAPRAPWTRLDRLALLGSVVVIAVAALWL